jgi:formate dehydrogenase subunit gamma
MLKTLITTVAVALGLLASNGAIAQAPAVQSVNIADVKPDGSGNAKADASADANYLKQSNGERAQVQPGNNAPLWRQVGQGVAGYSSLPVTQAPEAGVLIQPTVQYPGSRVTNAGEAWRQVRNQWLIPYGMAFICIALLACAILYFGVGKLGKVHPETGLMIERFTPVERAAHWANAGAFVLLALSGMTMAFGKTLLLPLMGTTLFGWLAYALKNLHNFVGPLFAVSLAVIIVIFVKDNIANAADFFWLKKLGGLLSDKQIPSHRFNAGEKGIFWWAVTIPGIVVVGSGLILDKLVPGLGDMRGEMQITHMIHLACALWMIALICGHIYMGTLGVPGAYEGMKTGYVPEGWAQEHHELWLDDVKAGKIPVQRSATPSSASNTEVPAASA